MLICGCGGMSLDILSFIPHEEVFFYDDLKAGLFEGYKILGTIDDLCRTQTDDVVYLGIGSVGNNKARNRIYEKLTKAGLRVRPLIFPSRICHNVQIGDNTVIGLGSQIHHDCVINDNSVLSPRVTLCGNVHVCKNVFIGAGVIVIQGVTIGLNSIVGAGSIVIKDVPANTVVVGNPAKFLRTRS
jgi:acetyltransferase-like isoleucine patch superfamily enzyme